jgi:cytochrome b
MTLVVENDADSRSARVRTVRVWDPIVRIFHWSLVAAFAIAWFTGDELMSVHEFAGYVIIGLVAIRIVWGLFGSRHARFADFIKAPGTIIRFLRDSLSRRASRYLGHNPAGGAMVVFLLAMLIAITATGYMQTTDAFWGVRWVREAHEIAVNVALVAIVLHVAGVIFASVEHRENLVKAMITGKKEQRAD